MQPVLRLEDACARLKPVYTRIALVAADAQLRLVPGDEDTLVVSCDWLAWQKASAEGRHCLFYEWGLKDWYDNDHLHRELFIRANDWLYDGDRDITLYRGVSLGKSFANEVSVCLANHARLSVALTNIVQAFAIREIVYYDFRNETDGLTPEMRRTCIEMVCADNGLSYSDQSASVDAGSYTVSEHAMVSRERPRWQVAMLNAYGLVAEALTSLRTWGRKGERPLLMIGTNMAAPLAEQFDLADVTPMFTTRVLPKGPRMLMHCLRRGIRLVRLTAGRPNRADRQRAGEVIAEAERLFARPAPQSLRFVQAYVRECFLKPDRVAAAAAQVRSIERLFDRHKFTRVVVDGVRHWPPRAIMEVAALRHVPMDSTWHSSLAPNNVLLDALGGDPRMPPLVSRCLTWGSAHEEWLQKTNARQPVIRVGCPIAERYRGAVPVAKPLANRAEVNVLLLQYTPIWGLNVNMYESFVDLVRLLRAKGFRKIWMKLHPGRGRWRREYFLEIAEFFGLGCEIFKYEPYSQFAAWADMVVGPALSGSFFETLAAGKRHYPMIMRPHGFDLEYYRDCRIVERVEEIDELVERDEPIDARKLFDAFYSVDTIDNAALAFWHAVGKP
ncbi:MAG: hypothetical protein H7Z12_10955 [Rhodospirillaceae bacterium]|nr:hypothetical protein [Rhodospirillales bacterium]